MWHAQVMDGAVSMNGVKNNLVQQSGWLPLHRQGIVTCVTSFGTLFCFNGNCIIDDTQVWKFWQKMLTVEEPHPR